MAYAPEALGANARSRLRGSFWPSDLQEQLLVVALGDSDAAAAAWRSIRGRFVLDELEPGSFDLMPLVYHRLAELLPDEPLLERLKGVYRREWVRANLLVERTKEVAAILGASGVPALFIEGAVLATRYYPMPALRTSWFVDVLVEPGEAMGALRSLTAAGWAPPPPGTPSRQRWALSHPDRTVCVVRTAPAYDFVSRNEPPAANAPLWQAAEPYELGGATVTTVQPTETLLTVCVAGARAQEPPSVTWIVDATMILRSSGINWERFVEIGVTRAQAPRLLDALTYLSRLPGTDVPAHILRKLASAPVTPRERLGHALASGSLRSAGALPELTARHLAATAQRSTLDAVVTFPAHLRAEWGVARAWQLPAAIARRVARRLGSSRA
jgi:hypothetical protein